LGFERRGCIVDRPCVLNGLILPQAPDGVRSDQHPKQTSKIR
jgi:hypothetical protein